MFASMYVTTMYDGVHEGLRACMCICHQETCLKFICENFSQVAASGNLLDLDMDVLAEVVLNLSAPLVCLLFDPCLQTLLATDHPV